MIVENPYSHTAALIVYHQEVPPVAALGSYSHLSDEFQVSVALAYVVILEIQSLGGLSLLKLPTGSFLAVFRIEG